MNATAALNVSIWLTARASMFRFSTSALMLGAMPWYRSPPACIPGGMNVWPSVCILTTGAMAAESP